MGDDKFKKLSTDLREMTHYAEEQRLGKGKIEFDELGNAIWVPSSTSVSGDVMMRLLDDPTLALADENAQGTQRVKKNPAGLK